MRAGTFLLAVLVAGCAPFSVHGQSDPWDPVRTTGEYREVSVVFTHTSEGARSLCGKAGLDLARTEGVKFAEGGHWSSGFGAVRVKGCYVPLRDLIVCAWGDQRCLEHEYRHAREGLVHS